jgi:multiple sugar transport system permease protein
VALLLVVLMPFLWLVQLAFRRRPTSSTTPAVRADAGVLQPACCRATSQVLRQQPAGQHAVDRLSLLIGVPAAYALTRWNFKGRDRIALWILVTRMAPPIAFTIPFFLAYQLARPAGHVIGLAIVYLTFNLAIVIWLMQTFFEAVPAGAGGSRLDRRLRRLAGVLARHAAAHRAGPGRHRGAVLHLLVERLLLRADPHAHQRHHRAGGDRQLPAVRRLGVDQDRRSGTLVMLPVVVFTVLVRTYLVRGLTAGGLKD